MVAAPFSETAWKQALTNSIETLRRVAEYSLDSVLDRRFTELGENKDQLTPEEHAELLAWVAFTQERSLEKLGAEAALQRLLSLCPDLGSSP